MKYLGVAEIYIRRIAQNVPILMIFLKKSGEHDPVHPDIKISLLYGSHSPSVTSLKTSMPRSATGLISCIKLICNSRGVDGSGRSRVNELSNE